MKIKLTLDRIEKSVMDSIAVCVSLDDGKIFHCPSELLSGIPEGGIFEAETDGNTIRSFRFLPIETAETRNKNQSRLDTLFSREGYKEIKREGRKGD